MIIVMMIMIIMIIMIIIVMKIMIIIVMIIMITIVMKFIVRNTSSRPKDVNQAVRGDFNREDVATMILKHDEIIHELEDHENLSCKVVRKLQTSTALCVEYQVNIFT